MSHAQQTTLPYPDGPSIRTADWIAAKALISQVQKEAERSSSVLRTVCSFLSVIDVLRSYEEQLIDIPTPTDTDMEFYHNLLMMSRGLGGMILTQVRQQEGLDLSQLGFTLADLEAMVTEFDYMETMHFPKSTPERIQSVATLFAGGCR